MQLNPKLFELISDTNDKYIIKEGDYYLVSTKPDLNDYDWRKRWLYTGRR